MIPLVLVRHGESIWNLENRFTGWTDVPLSEKGILESKEAGRILKQKNFTFDVAFTSVLKRAVDTLDYILEELGTEIPIYSNYHLNERHYGALQGLNKAKTALEYGEKQVLLWRRSAKEYPPALTKDDPRYSINDPKYKDLKESEIPLTENLSDTIKRVVEYYNEIILPRLKKGEKILIVAHGNSLRGLMKHLDNMTDEEVISLELETGNPICYELDDDLKPICHYYLK